MKTWLAQYIYAKPDGSRAVALRRITASFEAEARQLAVEFAPAAEFMLTLLPQSDDQELGTVKRDALWLSGKGRRAFDEGGEGR